MGRRGKGRRRRGGAPTTQLRDPVSEGALANYFSTLVALGTGRLVGENLAEQDELARLTAVGNAMVREARVFAVAPQTADEIESTVQAEVTLKYALPYLVDALPELKKASLEQRVAALPSVMARMKTEGRESGQLPDEVVEAYDNIDAAAKKVELPRVERWPFPSLWIGFGKGTQMTADETLNRHVWANTVQMIAKGPHTAVLLGYLIFDAGNEFGVQVSEVYCVPGVDSPLICAVYDERAVYGVGSGWLRGGDHSPWVIKALMELIMESRTSLLERQPTFQDRRIAAARADRSGVPMPVPRPYYVVRVRHHVVREKARSVARRRLPQCPWQLRHRFDVSAHERCRIQRGPLPLDPETRAKLERRRYKIYTLEQPSAEDQRRLVKRGIAPKHSHEWLAILTSQVGSFQKGPEGAPYVPAIRRVV